MGPPHHATVDARGARGSAYLLDSEFVSEHTNYRLLQLLKKQPDLRPHFAWGLLQAAQLAKSLGIPGSPRLSSAWPEETVWCLWRRRHPRSSSCSASRIDVFGFDTGAGLPPPKDYRDLPNLYRPAGFPMDQEKLRRRLKKARLILGDVGQTIGGFIESGPAPVGFVSIDVDLYTSTMAAFKLFDAGTDVLMPRVYCYLDDILGETFSEFTGERLAVSEFNAAHDMRKDLSHLRVTVFPAGSPPDGSVAGPDVHRPPVRPRVVRSVPKRLSRMRAALPTPPTA